MERFEPWKRLTGPGRLDSIAWSEVHSLPRGRRVLSEGRASPLQIRREDYHQRMKFLTFLLLTLGVTNHLLAATPAASEHAMTTSQPTPAGFKVDGYQIVGNTLLTYEQLEPIFTNYVGNAVT